MVNPPGAAYAVDAPTSDAAPSSSCSSSMGTAMRALGRKMTGNAINKSHSSIPTPQTWPSPRPSAPAPPKGAAWQRYVWVLLDDPGSSKLAKYLSFLLMMTIAVSVVNFCLASVPFNCWYVDDGYVNETIVNSSGEFVVRYLSESPVRKCDETDESADSPFALVEMACIIVFTLEFLLRIAASPAGPGVVGFCCNAANLVDVVAIVPWYVELVILSVVGTGSDLSFLSVAAARSKRPS